MKPDDSRLKPTPASWRIATVPYVWDLENVTETLKQIGFLDIDILSKRRQRGGSAWIFRALRPDDRDQLQLHFDEENDEPALDALPSGARRVPKPGEGNGLFHALAQAETIPSPALCLPECIAQKQQIKFAEFWDQHWT